jgi:hypothetical protein
MHSAVNIKVSKLFEARLVALHFMAGACITIADV